MGHLQFNTFACDGCPILTPIKLEGFSGLKDQWHKGATTNRLLGALSVGAPCTGKSRYPLIGSIIAELHQICMHLLHGPPVLTWFAQLR